MVYVYLRELDNILSIGSEEIEPAIRGWCVCERVVVAWQVVCMEQSIPKIRSLFKLFNSPGHGLGSHRGCTEDKERKRQGTSDPHGAPLSSLTVLCGNSASMECHVRIRK